jgi:hypothetical protein
MVGRCPYLVGERATRFKKWAILEALTDPALVFTIIAYLATDKTNRLEGKPRLAPNPVLSFLLEYGLLRGVDPNTVDK